MLAIKLQNNNLINKNEGQYLNFFLFFIIGDWLSFFCLRIANTHLIWNIFCLALVALEFVVALVLVVVELVVVELLVVVVFIVVVFFVVLFLVVVFLVVVVLLVVVCW